jgi:hypothetical protein
LLSRWYQADQLRDRSHAARVTPRPGRTGSASRISSRIRTAFSVRPRGQRGATNDRYPVSPLWPPHAVSHTASLCCADLADLVARAFGEVFEDPLANPIRALFDEEMTGVRHELKDQVIRVRSEKLVLMHLDDGVLLADQV